MSASADFWSRRKAGVAAEAEAEREAGEAGRAAAEEARLAAVSDEDLLAELGLPDPDTLGSGDDFAAFLGRAVPERLRRRALRRLWVSNPVLANLDGLVDHGEDFTDGATVVADLPTVYRVGRGMVERLAEIAKVASPAEPDAEPQPVAEAEADLPGEIETAAGPASAPTPGPRHMRFAFEGR